MRIEIRPFEPSDEQAIVALWNEALPSNAPHNDPTTAIQKKMEVDPELFFVALVQGAIAGTAMGGYDGHRGWIYTVAVAAEHRHRGIGTALIQRVEAALAERGCMKINLQVRTLNSDVIAFYQKLGYDIDEVVSMGKRLYPPC